MTSLAATESYVPATSGSEYNARCGITTPLSGQTMPLLDHFRPPLSQERHWESFHAAWSGALADALNQQLPAGYFAEELTHAGDEVEIDVATFEGRAPAAVERGNGSATATAPAHTWSPPAPAFTIPNVFVDDFEVRVFATRTGPTLVAAIELVSPGNKDRPETRRAFAIKCASYLHQGISLIVIDIVTDRLANLHNEIMHLVRAAPAVLLPPELGLYAAAYRPIRRDGREEIDLWPCRLALAESLPKLPLVVNPEVILPVDLEATYMDACRRRRLAG